MLKVGFYTLGCKVNQYETESMIELFKKNNYEIVEGNAYADVYVINTCTVTNMSDRKSRQMIRRANSLNPKSIIAVTGCYAQTNEKDILDIPFVDIVIGTNGKGNIVELVNKALENKNHNVIKSVYDIMEQKDFEETPVENTNDMTRAYLKIQDGCERYCSYCIIPFARGPIRSRKPQEIIEEIKRLIENGFKEIVLAGIHVASYGKDLKDENIDLIGLIELIHDFESLKRIRLSSIEPLYFTKENINRIEKLPKLCNHFHLSLQSGCDETLKRMNRKYSIAQYKEVVENLRENIKNVSITTDIIVGFPGETNSEFEETYKFLKSIKLTKLHVFRYSPREGTKAAKMPDQVPEAEKIRRSNILLELSDRCTEDFYSQFINKDLNLLVEQKIGDYYEGYSENYIKIKIKSNSELKGRIISIKPVKYENELLYARFPKVIKMNTKK